MGKLNIAITGINASDNPAPGIGVARSLIESDLDVNIIGLAYDAMEPGIYMDWLIKKSYLVPYPSAKAHALIDRLLYIKEQTGIEIIIPTLDSEFPFYIKYQDTLKTNGIEIFIPTKQQFELRDKKTLDEFAAKLKINFPKQKIVTSHAELSEAIAEVGFPHYIKGTLYKAYRSYSYDESIGYFNKIVAEWGYPIIVQQAILGDEMNVIGVGDGAGGIIGAITIKKLSTTDVGKIWTGVTIKNDALNNTLKDFAKQTKWKGAFELECIVDDDSVTLIEINPRFPAWVYFATGVGVNLPEMMVKLLTNEKIKKVSSYPIGKLYIRYVSEKICDMEQYQNIVTNGET